MPKKRAKRHENVIDIREALMADPVEPEEYRPPNAPSDLSKPSQRIWYEVVRAFELETHGLTMLKKALEAHDMMIDARAILDEEGLVIEDRFGQPKPHPAQKIWKDGHAAFLAAWRMLGVDHDPPMEIGRPPGK